MTYRFAIVAFLLLSALPAHCAASLSYASINSTLSENFDYDNPNHLNSLARNNGDDDQTWTNDTTIPGWYLYHVTSGTNAAPLAVALYDTHTGDTTASGFYSFGDDGANDRALGGIGGGNFYAVSPDVATGGVAGWIAVSVRNDSGSTLNGFTLGFDGEQWRRGQGNGANVTMEFQYGYGTNFTDVTTWNHPGGNFDWNAPQTIGAELNGNATGTGGGLVEDRGGTVNSQNWAAGDTLWMRWLEVNEANSDHAMAIDNFTFQVTAVPEPTGAPVRRALAGGVIGLGVAGRRLKNKLLGHD